MLVQAYVNLQTASLTVEVKREDTGARSFGDVEVSVQEADVTEVTSTFR